MNLSYNYECILSILIENQPSILTRIVGLFTRRGFIIESLTIGTSEYDHLSRIMVVFFGNMKLIDQVMRQLYKLFAIVKINNLTPLPIITRELILIKIFVNEKDRKDILEIVDVFNLEVLDFTNKTLTLEITGDSKKILAIEQLLNRFEILEKIRTGKIGLVQESVTGSKLYKVDQEKLRRKIMNSHIFEFENKLYL